MGGWVPRVRRTPQRWWLIALLLAMAFSALQGLLGAAAVTALTGGGPVVEVCTPQGMQWMPLAEVSRGHPADPDPDPSAPPGPRGLAQPCAWVLAHVSVPPAPQNDERRPLLAPPRRVEHRPDALVHLLPDDSGRILLNAPMRAPPAASV